MMIIEGVLIKYQLVITGEPRYAELLCTQLDVFLKGITLLLTFDTRHDNLKTPHLINILSSYKILLFSCCKNEHQYDFVDFYV